VHKKIIEKALGQLDTEEPSLKQNFNAQRPVIGVGTYILGSQPGTIEAEWFDSGSDEHKTLKGLATGGTPGVFEGNYKVVYFDSSGGIDAELDLEIVRNGKTFDLYWSKNNEVRLFGVGFKCEDRMVLSYRPFD